MKTLKYRSVLGVLTTAALSVFLFTACEKESDNTPTKPDRLSKFKSLVYSGGSASTTANSGSGTFLGNNSNITFIPPGGAGSSEVEFAPAAGNDNGFTDPMSTESSFVISNGFTLGGGTVTLGNRTYDIDLGFCASSDIFGYAPGQGGNENESLDAFIGISGDFDIGNVDDTTNEMPFNMILYVFSFNGGSSIGDFINFENGDVESGAFVLAAEFDDQYEDVKLYFSTSGSVDFAGSNVTLSGISMVEVFDSMQGNELGNETVSLQAFLECGSFDPEEEEQ
jgi:hypothetical protein